jgi:hypothetical protein
MKASLTRPYKLSRRQTQWPLVRERTIERLSNKVSAVLELWERIKHLEALKMETVRSPKRRLKLVLHGTNSIRTSLVDTAVTALISPFLQAALGPGVYSASNRNEVQKQNKLFLRSIERPEREAENLTAICEPTVWTMRGPQHHETTGLVDCYSCIN